MVYNARDFGGLFRFLLTHGRNHMKPEYIAQEGGDIAETYRVHFSQIYDDPEKALNAAFDVAVDALKDESIRKALRITSL